MLSLELLLGTHVEVWAEKEKGEGSVDVSCSRSVQRSSGRETHLGDGTAAKGQNERRRCELDFLVLPSCFFIDALVDSPYPPCSDP